MPLSVPLPGHGGVASGGGMCVFMPRPVLLLPSLVCLLSPYCVDVHVLVFVCVLAGRHDVLSHLGARGGPQAAAAHRALPHRTDARPCRLVQVYTRTRTRTGAGAKTSANTGTDNGFRTGAATGTGTLYQQYQQHQYR